MKNFFFRLVDWLVGWLVVLKIYVALAVFQPYRDLEAGDNQSSSDRKASVINLCGTSVVNFGSILKSTFLRALRVFVPS